MMKRQLCLLALPLLSITACLDMSDQDAADVTSSQASLSTLDPGDLAGSPEADAPAAVDGRICETYGSRCVGAPTIAFQDPVIETDSGRNLQIARVAGGWHLAFTADLTRCVAVKNGTTQVEVRACASAASAVWTILPGPDGHSCRFQNTVNHLFLGGPNDGGKFSVVGDDAAGGWLKQFYVPGLPRGILPGNCSLN